MRRISLPSLLLTAAAYVLLAGCAPKMTIEEMKAHMPERPTALDQLDAFAGKWRFEGEAKFTMLDEPIAMSGEEEYRWSGDRWYLISDGSYSMGELGDSKGHSVWTYDAGAKCYRSMWVDSMGSFGTGTSTYDEDTGVWRMSATNHGAMGKSSMKGTMEFVDKDTMKWSMTESAGLMKVAEMTGTAKRIK